jgi:dethiobiotin synthetase
MTPLSHSRPFSCFVTGTDTEIGKTFVSCALLHAFAQSGARVVGMKPVAAGAVWREDAWRNEDVDALAIASTSQFPQALTAPYVFPTPAAPHIAAAIEGVCIDPTHILSCYQQLREQSDA